MKAGWAVSTLGETCEMYQPKTITAKEMMLDGPYPVFGANGVIGRYDQFNHEEPQLLITCRGATCGTVNVSEPKSWITGNAMVVRPKGANIDLRFLEYLFRGGMDISPAITGAAQPQITRTNLNPIAIRYPLDSQEQQRIVTLLDEAFEGIATAKANAEKNLQNARAIFESHLQSVFNNQGDGWKCIAFEDTVDSACTLSYGIVQPGEEYAGGMPIVRPTDLGGKTIEIEGLKRIDPALAASYRRTTLRGGDLLLCVRGTTGQISIASKDLAGANVTRGIVPIFFEPTVVAQDFGYYLMRSGFVQSQIREKTYGTALQQINIGDLRNLKLPIPPLAKQAALTTRFDELSGETQRLESIYQQKLTALDDLKKSLLHRAFNGDL